MTYDALLVGCGHRGQVHAEILAGAAAFDLVAVCDVDADSARETGTAFGVPEVYDDLTDALDGSDPDHVSVATPPTARASIVEPVLDRAPDSLLVEKPVATSFEEVCRIADLVEGSEARVTVCHQHVYQEEIATLRDWIDAGRLGELERLVGTTKGGLFEHGTHFLHTLDFLLGESPDRVRAHADWSRSGEEWYAEYEPSDTVVELVYGDCRAFLHLGADAPDRPEWEEKFWLEYGLDVVGRDGRGRFVLGDHVTRLDADGNARVEAEGFDVDARSTRALYHDLTAVLQGEREVHPADVGSALDAHRTIEAALRSAENGTAVAPPDLAGRSVDNRK